VRGVIGEKTKDEDIKVRQRECQSEGHRKIVR